MNGRRAAESRSNPMSKHQIQPECGEWADLRGTRWRNLSSQNEFSGANGDREIFIFPVHLTTRAGLATLLG